MKRSEIPRFGVLNGVQVVYSAPATAGPYAAELMADFGADVLWIESPMGMDSTRLVAKGLTAEAERRNQRNISLDIPSAEGRKIFLRLLKNADIFIEASKGGQFVKWGLTDDVLWRANPRLVIVHVSGFGQTGIPEYVSRPSYDQIGQSFGCYMQLNGLPDSVPVAASPVPCDYMTALFAATSALAALHKAKETGNGESIDLAQYEVMMRVQGYAPMEFLNFGVKPSREDAHNAYLAGVGCYEFADGRFVYIMLYGTAILNRVLPLLGLQFGSDLFPSNMPAIQLHTAAGQLLEEKLGEFCKRHTATEASELLLQAGAPVSVVYDYEMALHDPHYKAREVFVEWNTVESKPIKGINIFPKFKKNPGRIWRGAPYAGWTTRMSWKN